MSWFIWVHILDDNTGNIVDYFQTESLKVE